MLFYINSFKDKELGDNDFVGLFSTNAREGRGNFCGWYGAEYYLNTDLLAYYPFNNNGSTVNFKKKSGLAILTRKHYDEIEIGSGYWEIPIEVETLEEALKKFTTLDF